MALTCPYPGCDRATKCIGSSEREDGNVVVEKYECEFGHISHETVELA